jgi:hypothetical protein
MIFLLRDTAKKQNESVKVNETSIVKQEPNLHEEIKQNTQTSESVQLNPSET